MADPDDPTLRESAADFREDQQRARGLFNNGPEEDGYVDESGRTVPSIQKLLKGIRDAAAAATADAEARAEQAAAEAATSAQQAAIRSPRRRGVNRRCMMALSLRVLRQEIVSVESAA